MQRTTCTTVRIGLPLGGAGGGGGGLGEGAPRAMRFFPRLVCHLIGSWNGMWCTLWLGIGVMSGSDMYEIVQNDLPMNRQGGFFLRTKCLIVGPASTPAGGGGAP